MSPIAFALSILTLAVTSVLIIWQTLRADRRERKREREQSELDREKEQKRQLQQMEQMIQTMVVEKIEAAFSEIEKLQRSMGDVKESHAHMRGFLQGRGILVPDLTADDLKGARV